MATAGLDLDATKQRARAVEVRSFVEQQREVLGAHLRHSQVGMERSWVEVLPVEAFRSPLLVVRLWLRT
jgi:hypothetical protein